ncbi:MAG: cyclase [Ruminococcaceae bacterium]|nr:cyclase [Oscillospiraceae bacterium]
MLIDITLKITPAMAKESNANTHPSLVGHLGTHFDVMDKEFPLEYTRRRGIVFDVSSVRDRDVDICDIDLSRVERDSFVAFRTGFIDDVPYGTREYFSTHPQLSDGLIDALLDKGVSIIAIDCAGIRRGKEHTTKDQYCAERDTFVIENLCCLDKIIENGSAFTAHTYPMSYSGITGLPCRVVAEI